MEEHKNLPNELSQCETPRSVKSDDTNASRKRIEELKARVRKKEALAQQAVEELEVTTLISVRRGQRDKLITLSNMACILIGISFVNSIELKRKFLPGPPRR